jgi:hypothetical protein
MVPGETLPGGDPLGGRRRCDLPYIVFRSNDFSLFTAQTIPFVLPLPNTLKMPKVGESLNSPLAGIAQSGKWGAV